MLDVRKETESLSNFKNNSVAILQRLRANRRALILTIDTRPEGVLLSPEVFQKILDHVAYLEAHVGSNDEGRTSNTENDKTLAATSTQDPNRWMGKQQENLEAALSMIPVGLRIAQDRMRREFPGASEDEINCRARELLRGGEGGSEWFRPISAQRYKRIFGE